MNKFSNWLNLEDLNLPKSYNTQFCIIGAGAAGIYLATELSKLNFDVILLEAGGEISSSTDQIGFTPSFAEQKYLGAIDGRYFGIGGSTAKWGGALVPHNESDYNVHDIHRLTWAEILNKIDRNLNYVLKQLGYNNGANFYEFPQSKLESETNSLAKRGFKIHSNLYLPFTKKNFRGLLNKVSYNSNLKVIYNAVASDWGYYSDNYCNVLFKYLIARSTNNEIKINADKFIIAAGAIESARILLEMNSKGEGSLFNETNSIGKYLSDHLSLPIADVDIDDRKKVIDLFSPYFESNWMRGIRFLNFKSSKIQPRYFAHFIFENNSLGFELAKEIFSSLQARRIPKIKFIKLLRGLSDLILLFYFKTFRSRLYYEKNTKSHLQLDIEQHADNLNEIYLSEERDKYNRQKLVIKWSISNKDYNSITSVANNIISNWNSVGNLPKLIPRSLEQGLSKPYDAYHPVGTCRIGNISDSVVDNNLKVWGTSNVWVVSTGVLPSAGTANPTLTLLCLANELIKNLKH